MVKERREYDSLLNINSLSYTFTFKLNGPQIIEIMIDTTKGASIFFRQLKQKSDEFLKWWHGTYPGETNDELYEKDGLLVRLREYIRSNLN
jgi:hypothetical protein